MTTDWCSVTSGQRPETNEIITIPELLDALDTQATVTTDAVGCQRAIAEKIVQSNYLVAVKDNRSTLAQAVESLFKAVDSGVRDGRLLREMTVDKTHGRIETRQCVVAHDVMSTLAEPGQRWPGLRSAVMAYKLFSVENATVLASTEN